MFMELYTGRDIIVADEPSDVGSVDEPKRCRL